MIRAKVTGTSYLRDDALQYLANTLAKTEWEGWSRAGDISLVQTRRDGSTRWVATAVVVREETPVAPPEPKAKKATVARTPRKMTAVKP